MSRGGRGGGFGGRGGRGGGGSDNPWANDPNLQVDGRPSELFPVSVYSASLLSSSMCGLLTLEFFQPYNVPTASLLTKKEEKQVSYFLLFREQVHDGPLFTQTR